MRKIKRQELQNRPYVMYFFLALQTVVFLIMELKGFSVGGSENPQILYTFGAMEKNSVLVLHQYWRFITPIFIHIGLTHFVVNSVTLYFIGAQVELIYGHWRFFVIYLLSGIFGNLFSFSLSQGNSLSAGASTALFGLFGAFIMLWRYFKDNYHMQFFVKRYLTFVLLNLFFNLFSPSVDILGHLGGLIGGLLLANTLRLRIKSTQDKSEQLFTGAVFIICCFFLLIYGFKKYGFTL